MESNTTMPIFSVVVPVYNVEKYLSKCLESVLQQSYQNFEIVCVDDGSPDNSVDIINAYNDPRIRLVRQKNRGLAAARNTGIKASRGLYVALLDSDDFWHKDKLKAHYKHLSENAELGISYSASRFVDEAGNDMGIGQYPKLKNISAKDIFCRNPIGNGSAPVLRKAMLNEMAQQVEDGGETRTTYFNENMRQSEDVEFWLRAALSTKYQFEGLSQALTYYRVNMSGLSANLDKQYASWLYSVKQNRKINPRFVDQWFSLASAYQLRYLARRAVQARNATKALQLTLSAMRTDVRIMLEEPKRTIATFACSLLSFLPQKLYDQIEQFAMKRMQQR